MHGKSVKKLLTQTTHLGHGDNPLSELSQKEVLIRNTVLPLKTGRIWEELKRKRKHQPIIYPTNLPESFTLEPILAEGCPHHQEGP